MHLLCAHISGDRWLCHSGSKDGVGDLRDNPFGEADLVVKDLVEDAWDTKRRKRLRTDARVDSMRCLVQTCDERWCRVVAIANFRAEQARAAQGEFNKRLALSRFEKNPFLWEVGDGKSRSQADVVFLWTWRTRVGDPQLAFVSQSLHHIRERSFVTCPQGMSQQDLELHRKLLSAAEVETRVSKAPCVYLGLQTATDQYEPDPGSWTEGSTHSCSDG